MMRVGILLCLLSLASAGHFKYGTLSWKHLGMNSVEFHLTSAWSTEFGPYKEQGTGGQVTVGDVIRVQGLGNPVLEYGDGHSDIIKALVTSVDTSRQTWVGQSTLLHQYAAPNNMSSPWNVVFSGCCRSDDLDFLAAGSNFNILTNVDLAVAQYSPQVQVLPRITVRASGDAGGNGDFYIAANDPGVHPTDVSTGTKLRWSISLDNNLVPPGISINAMSGKVSTSMNEGLYAFTIVVRDVNTSVFTTTELELEVVSVNATMPSFDDSFPGTRLPSPATNLLYVGFMDSFIARFLVPGAAPSLAIGDPAPHVKVQAGNLPIGATFSPVAVGGFATPPSNSTIKGYHSVFEWTPTAADVGWHSICVYLETNFSAPSSQVCFDVSVQPDPAPEWITTNSASFTATMGKELLVTLEAIDLNPSDNITIEGVNLPDGALLSPPVFEQRPVGLVTVRNLTWVPGETMGGLGGEMCVRATDDGTLPGRSANSPADLCFQYIVPKCRYSVGGAEGLVQVASRFKTNWLQLWALNKDITRPEGYGNAGQVYEGFELNVGQLVRVRDGDSLEKIVGRFGTTVRQTLGMNADILGTAPLASGQLVCIVPNSCREKV